MNLFYVANSDQLKQPIGLAASEALAHARAKVQAGIRSSILIYVHGRAGGLAGIFGGDDREPEKSFSKDKIVAELETRFGQAVVMLHWPHSGNPLVFPIEDARQAKARFGELMASLSAVPAEIPVRLLTHSMGSMVLEAWIRDVGIDTATLALGRLRSCLISAPASALDGSKKWLAACPRPVVTLNKDDQVLKHISEHGPLGLMVASGVGEERCESALYVDLGPLSVSHRTFVMGESNSPDREFIIKNVIGPTLQAGVPDMAALVATPWPNVWKTPPSMAAGGTAGFVQGEG